MSAATPELVSYHANCHCGAVTYTVRIPSLTQHEVSSCNCSICTRNGYLVVYPERKDVVFHTGYDHLISYFFGSKIGAHKFCPTCGSSVLCDLAGYDFLAINVRLFQDIDINDLKCKDVNGKEMKPEYQAPKMPEDDAPTADSELSAYPANCHCGAVTYTVRIPSLTHHEVVSCNCSICTRNGYLLVYPERKDVIFHSGYDHMVSYFCGRKQNGHKFCPSCGSSILIDLEKTIKRDRLAINTRMLQDINPKDFKYSYVDGKTKLKPDYEAPKW